MKEALQRFSKRLNYLLISYFLAFLTIANIVSCDGCENIQVDNNSTQSPKLIISTDKKAYQGLSDLKVILQLSHADKNTNMPATYSNFKLKVTVTQESGTENSTIQYTAFDKAGSSITTETASVNERLTHFFKVTDTELIAPTEVPQIIFNIIPKGNPTKVTVHYELLDPSKKDKSLYKHTITWKPIQDPIPTYKLNLEGENTTIQAPAPIKLEIKEREGRAIEIVDISQLKVEIIRQSGDATLNGIDNDGKLEVTFMPADIDNPNSLIKKTLPVTIGHHTETIFKLQLKYGNVDMGEALVLTYKKQPAEVWQFEVIGADTATHTLYIEGTTDIEIRMNKVGNTIITEEEIEELKLHIKRTAGAGAGAATLVDIKDGILKFKDSDKCTLATDRKSATKKLTIQPSIDKSTSFSLGLQDKMGTPIGTIHQVIWKNGAQLKLEPHYDNSTGKVTVTITNNGKINLAANQATLSWDTGDDDVTITNSKKGSQQLNEIVLNDNSIPLELGHVTFKNGKMAATLNLELEWNQLEETIQATQPLTIIPIDITLTHISFDRLTNHINYNFKNNGKQDVDLQVKCINNETGNKAIINTKLECFTLRKDGETGNKTLQVYFNGENNADFKFSLLYNGLPINFKYKLTSTEAEKEIDEYIISCKPRRVKLKFELTNTSSANSIQLLGDNKEISFKIVPNGNTDEIVDLEQIDKNKLKLIVEEVNVTQAKIYQGTTPIQELLGDKLNLGNHNFFTIQPGNDNQAGFVFKLMYDEQGNRDFNVQLDQLPINWEEDKFEIIVQHPKQRELLGEEEGSFTIRNITGNINRPADITIELQSSNGVQFGCLNSTKAIPGQPASTTTNFQQNLQDLLGDNNIPNNKETPNIVFKMLNTNGQKESTITIIARKHEKEVARTTQIIKWRTNLNVRISSIQVGDIPIKDNILLDNGSNVDNTKAFKIVLQNDGDDISTDDINMQLENMYGIKFQLGHLTGTNIAANLTKIVGLNSPEIFQKNTTKEISFWVADAKYYLINDTLSIILKEPMEVKVNLIWINNVKLKSFVDDAQEFKRKFKDAVEKFNNHIENIKKDNINNDIEELYRALYFHMLFGIRDKEPETVGDIRKMLEDLYIDQLLGLLKENIDNFEKINTRLQEANKQPIQEIEFEYDQVKNVYTLLKNDFEKQATTFAKKLLEIAVHYITNANIENEPTAARAEEAFLKACNPFELLLKSLNSFIKYYYSKKHPASSFNQAIDKIYDLFIMEELAVATKYRQEEKNQAAEAWEKSAQSWVRE